MLVASGWNEYRLLDAGRGERLERWGGFVLRRPDPVAVWDPTGPPEAWEAADGHYRRSSEGGGAWRLRPGMPERWQIGWRDLAFHVRPMGFKHTGVFPEQAANWEWLMPLVALRPTTVRVLNLFAYTGGATLALARAGAEVTHVDAARGIVTLARENLNLCRMGDRPVRWLVDDAVRFVQRELRRGSRYEAVVMDPPSYGRGPKGETWKIEDLLAGLVASCAQLLSDEPLFLLLNSYTTGLSPTAAANLLELAVRSGRGGTVTADELGLPIGDTGLLLPCGVSGRWTAG